MFSWLQEFFVWIFTSGRSVHLLPLGALYLRIVLPLLSPTVTAHISPTHSAYLYISSLPPQSLTETRLFLVVHSFLFCPFSTSIPFPLPPFFIYIGRKLEGGAWVCKPYQPRPIHLIPPHVSISTVVSKFGLLVGMSYSIYSTIVDS